MRIEPLNVKYAVGPDRCLTTASAALAEARKVWHEMDPKGVSWAAVHSEASRLRIQEPLTLVQALQVVLDRLAIGAWTPQQS